MRKRFLRIVQIRDEFPVATDAMMRRYAIIGTGMRAHMYIDAIAGEHSDVAELVALVDTNEKRAAVHADRIVEIGGTRPLITTPDDLADLIRRERIDRVIIASPDATHADHIVTALHAGADAVVEKPLTIDEESARRIAKAVRETGRDVTVTFNYRYSPRNSALREVIASGAIGRVTSVHFEWMLDTKHGADYFRRWHRDKSISGGLLIHKASHHFDLVNWWTADSPERVFASGGLRFYGAEGGGRPAGDRPSRGSVDEAAGDPFSLDLRTEDTLRKLYFETEEQDGYLRDRDVFDSGISIEDNLALVVDYASGASMTYALNAHSPWEGYNVAINGTLGRVELSVVERSAVSSGDSLDPSYSSEEFSDSAVRPVADRLVLQRHWAAAEEIEIRGGDGDHGGGDRLLLIDVFRGADEDPLARQADWVDGVASIAVGIAGNASLRTSVPVRIADLNLAGEPTS